MSKEKENDKKNLVRCCIMNCQKQINIDDAIVIEGKVFCGICGVAYYRSRLNI